MGDHLADLTSVPEYSVDLEFTSPIEPGTLSAGEVPLVSLALEIEANVLTSQHMKTVQQYGRIPYGSPLYWWETRIEDARRCVYIGQTVDLPLQKRFDHHTKIVRLLSRYVNDATTTVFYRLCSRFDINCSIGSKQYRWAIEHLPLDQARLVVTDIEAHLIYQQQPEFNENYKHQRKRPWKKFSVTRLTLA